MADTFAPQPVKTKTAGDVAVNNAQVGGTAVDTNSGNKSAGTQRFVIATDQPQLTNALKVDGSAVTQPVSAASLPLPTGAATSAKQPALGTAGSASTDVLSVQGIASMTALKVDGSAVTQPVSFGLSGTVTDDYNTSASLAAGATVTLDSTNIASGTGHLVEATVSSSVSIKAQLGTWDGTTFTVKRTFFVPANDQLVYIPQRYDEIQKATGATAKFRWSITNMDNANAADVYCSTTYWV